MPSIEGLTAKEYIVIALCSLILGLIYVASVFLYIHVKKNKSRSAESEESGANASSGAPKSSFPPNDQVTFGNGFSRGSYNRSVSSTAGDRHRSSGRDVSLNGLGSEEHGVVKSNPLLKHYPNLSDNSGFASDLSNSNSERDDERAITSDISAKNVSKKVLSARNTSVFLFADAAAEPFGPAEERRECERSAGDGVPAGGQCVHH